MRKIIAVGPEIPGWPDRACFLWKHVMWMRNQIIRRLLGDHGSEARRLNMTQIFHVISSVGVPCAYVCRKETNTSGTLVFKLDCPNELILVAAGSPLLPVFLRLIYLLSDSLCFRQLNSFNLMKIKACMSGNALVWMDTNSPESQVEPSWVGLVSL